MNEKQQFIDAYIWMYGCTKKRALQAYKEQNLEGIKLIISSYNNQCRQSFYND